MTQVKIEKYRLFNVLQIDISLNFVLNDKNKIARYDILEKKFAKVYIRFDTFEHPF